MLARLAIPSKMVSYATKVGCLHPPLSMDSDKATHKTIQANGGAAVEDVVKAVQRSVVRIRCKRNT